MSRCNSELMYICRVGIGPYQPTHLVRTTNTVQGTPRYNFLNANVVDLINVANYTKFKTTTILIKLTYTRSSEACVLSCHAQPYELSALDRPVQWPIAPMFKLFIQIWENYTVDSHVNCGIALDRYQETQLKTKYGLIMYTNKWITKQ